MTKRPAPIQCTALTARKKPCRNWAVHGSNPPRCSSHKGGIKHVGAPQGNTNALTHGVYAQPPDSHVDLDARIADLNRRIAKLSTYIDNANISTTEPDEEGRAASRGTRDQIGIADYTRLLALHGMLTSRLGRLLINRQQLEGTDDSELAQAISEALDLVGERMGLDL